MGHATCSALDLEVELASLQRKPWRRRMRASCALVCVAVLAALAAAHVVEVQVVVAVLRVPPAQKRDVVVEEPVVLEEAPVIEPLAAVACVAATP